MEIDITTFFRLAEPFDFSASQAERGENAGRDTWNNAIREGANSPLLHSEEQLDALRQWARDTGAWSKDEIAAWTDVECNALFIQIISGDMREMESLCTDDDGEVSWTEYERLSSEGTISGCLYRGDDGRIYYYLGS